MLLQKLIWNDTEEFGNQNLYIRNGKFTINNGNICMPANSSLTFDTYFNMFSVRKWRIYTNVEHISINLCLKGKGRVSLLTFNTGKEDKDQILYSTDFNCTDFETIYIGSEYRINDMQDFCYIKLEATTEVFVSSGEYLCSDEILQTEIHLACCICTYKREKDVKRNVHALENELIKNPNSLLYNNLKIYIADNGHTLKEEIFSEYKDVHIFENPNYGGSAGFTRTMIESVIFNQNKDLSHVILMDDDILIYPIVLERTYCFLRVLKKEFSKYMLGGASLALEQRELQFEASEQYDPATGLVKSEDRRKLDLTDRSTLVFNEEEHNANFNGWWYACIPVSVITKDNLPLPLFIHRDDQEYGVRLGTPVLQLNGICIWHPLPMNKHADYIFYYNARNTLIVSAELQDDVSVKEVRRRLLGQIVHACLSYQYQKALMILYGYKEFYNGIDAFKTLEPEKKHQEIMKKTSINWIPVTDTQIVKAMKHNNRLPSCYRILRYILPGKRQKHYVDGSNLNPSAVCGYKKVIIVRGVEKKGFELTKNWRKTFNVFNEWLKVDHIIRKKHVQCFNEWKTRINELMTIDFWKNYLKLDEKE